MLESILGLSDKRFWDDQMAANAEMFRQADLLDEAAYKIIEGDNGSPDAWARFTEAKAQADRRRTDAFRDWMRIKRAMKK